MANHLSFHRRLFIVLMIFISITGCRKTPYFSRSDLPRMSVGSFWQYQNIDSINHRMDTVTLTVISSTLSGDTQRVITLLERSGIIRDTTSFIISQQDIDFIGDTIIGSYHIRLPLSIGATWSRNSNRYHGSCNYYTQDEIVSEMHYAGFDISNSIDPYHSDECLISKSIGMLRMNYKTFDFVSGRNKFLYLIDYQLN